MTLNTFSKAFLFIYWLSFSVGCVYFSARKKNLVRRTTFTFCHLVWEPDVFVYRIRNLLSDSVPKHIVVVGLVGEKLFPAELWALLSRVFDWIHANDVESRIGKKRVSWREIAFFFVIDSRLFFFLLLFSFPRLPCFFFICLFPFFFLNLLGTILFYDPCHCLSRPTFLLKNSSSQI